MEEHIPVFVNNSFKRKTNYLYILIAFIFAILIIIAVTFYAKTKTIPAQVPVQNNISEPVSSTLDNKPVAEQLELIKSNSLINIPVVKKESLISESEFPENFLRFFGSSLDNLEVKSLIFDNNQDGFVANFTLMKNSREVLESAASGGIAYGWKLIRGGYTKSASFIELENSIYQASIEVTLPTDSIALVHAILIKK